MATKKKQQKRLIFLNFGSKNIKHIVTQPSLFSFEFYKTKDTCCFIKRGTNVTFISKGKLLDFSNSRVFTRLRGSDSQFCGIIHEHLDRHKIRFVDPINLKFRNADQKIAQMPRLAEAGIRVPETFIARKESFEANREFILSKIAFPAVFKNNGSQGRDVHIVNSIKELERLVKKQNEENHLFLIQEWIDNEWDIRTLMAFDECLGSIKRTRKKGFVNNVSAGAKVEKFETTKEMKEIATKACTVNGIDFGGVDFIISKDGPIVLEINKSPQIKGFEGVYGRGYVWQHIIKSLNQKS